MGRGWKADRVDKDRCVAIEGAELRRGLDGHGGPHKDSVAAQRCGQTAATEEGAFGVGRRHEGLVCH